MKTRAEQFATLFPDAPAYRWRQIEDALWGDAKGWSEVTALPKAMQAKLEKEVPWMSVEAGTVQQSAKKDTYKALLKLADGAVIESVLMLNRREQWTICVSSQVGCAMRCAFCATGKMGLKRNLSTDEITDQYRFWKNFLKGASRISNIVFMGMGEPLANYENVRAALNTLLARTDLGETRITVSTVGVLPRLDQILTDKEWPHVKLAISLHSADPETRKAIVPTSYDEFLPKIESWSKSYLKILGNRRHHLTFEYVMLRGVNDTPEHAKLLSKFVTRIGNIKVNLIPYNFTNGEFERSFDERIDGFLAELESHDITATRRRTMGDDIAAACGQLIVVSTKWG
jgi:adenine C2-methylase RlmN of 23S rRNA A2503 and tRNA A37